MAKYPLQQEAGREGGRNHATNMLKILNSYRAMGLKMRVTNQVRATKQLKSGPERGRVKSTLKSSSQTTTPFLPMRQL